MRYENFGLGDANTFVFAASEIGRACHTADDEQVYPRNTSEARLPRVRLGGKSNRLHALDYQIPVLLITLHVFS